MSCCVRKNFRHAQWRRAHCLLFPELRRALSSTLRQCSQNAFKAWTAIAVVTREVCSAEERLAIRREDCGQRPSALSTDGLHRGLVAAVYIGPLVAVYFYRD